MEIEETRAAQQQRQRSPLEAIGNAGATRPTHIPQFQRLHGKMNAIASLSKDLEISAGAVIDKMFGPMPESDLAQEAVKERMPEGVIEEFTVMLDKTYGRLESIQQSLNKLHNELGGNEN